MGQSSMSVIRLFSSSLRLNRPVMWRVATEMHEIGLFTLVIMPLRRLFTYMMGWMSARWRFILRAEEPGSEE